MSLPKQDGAFLLRVEQPFTQEHAASHAAAIAAAIHEARSGSVLRLDITSSEGLDASGLAVLLAAAKDCRARSVEFRLRLPTKLSELAEDLRLAKHAVVENPEVAP